MAYNVGPSCRLYDIHLDEILKNNLNLSVPWYIMASYAYYVEDNPILSDAAFDALAKRMLDAWDTIEHWHKSYLSLEDLEATTYLGEYPKRAIQALNTIRREGV